ncbi:MAG: 4Fe-4S binding protein [Victivallaceae bacterium]|nr:4Fe-4S binding protein [Victivallaceae bacterium]
MLDALRSRLFCQGFRTGKFPPAAPSLPDGFRGRPILSGGACPATCARCMETCPTGAIVMTEGKRPSLDTGKCLFCGKCAQICPEKAVSFSATEYRLGGFTREELIAVPEESYLPAIQKDEAIRKIAGRSLKIRQISAGGCAACELDFNVLNTLAWDMGRFGIQAVASPRHADAVLITGPVTHNMQLALQKCYDAMPHPCWVIACGSCAVSGGLYADAPTTARLPEGMHVDLFVPGCPPHPATLLEALLRFMGRTPEAQA